MSDSPKADDPKAPGQASDVVLLHSPTEDGKGVRVLRAREGRVEAGEVRPLESGKPLHGDLVTLKPRADAPRVCDVEVHYQARNSDESPALDHKGPPTVASAAYRKSWDRIFQNDAGDEGSEPSSDVN